MANSNSVDVLVATEIEAGPEAIIHVPGFNTYKAEPTTLGKTRLAILAREGLKVTPISSSPLHVWLDVHVAGRSIAVGGVYRQWTDTEKDDLDEIHAAAAKITKYNEAVMLGDFNLDTSRTGDPSYARAGLTSSHLATMEELSLPLLGPQEPTFFSYGSFNGSRRTSVLDHVYGRGILADITVLQYAATDHRPVLASISVPTSPEPPKWVSKTLRCLKKVNSDHLCLAIEEEIPKNLYQELDVDTVANMVVTATLRALDKVAPKKVVTVKKTAPLPYLAPDTKAVMVARDRAAAANCSKDYRPLRNKASRLLRRDKLDSVRTAIDRCGGDLKRVWSMADAITGPRAGGPPDNLPPAEINDFFLRKIVKIRARIPPTFLPSHLDQPHSPTSFSFLYPNAAKVVKTIMGLKNTEAAGVDEIPVRALKLGARALGSPVAHLVKVSLSTSRVPKIFKMAIVKPLHKGKGKCRQDPGSYRPVAILPALSKILERLVMSALSNHLEPLLPPSQFGFRPKRSTTAAVATAHGSWTKLKLEGKVVGVAGFDMSAAFDTVDPALLAKKLEARGIRGRERAWFMDYLSGRQQCVSASGNTSSFKPVNYGVPQGSILGPLLFVLMIADLPDYLAVPTVGYADDVAIWCSGNNVDDVQAALSAASDRMLGYASSHMLAVNPDKTQLMWVGGKGPNITMGGHEIAPANRLELLGVTYDAGLSASPYLKAQVTAAKRIKGKVMALSAHLPPNVVSLVSRALATGKLGYAVAATLPPRLTSLDPLTSDCRALQVAMNDVARATLGISRSNQLSVEKLLRKTSLPSINRLTVRSIAMEAWKALKTKPGGQPTPLGKLLLAPNPNPLHRSTRAVKDGKIPPPPSRWQPTPSFGSLTAFGMTRLPSGRRLRWEWPRRWPKL